MYASDTQTRKFRVPLSKDPLILDGGMHGNPISDSGDQVLTSAEWTFFWNVYYTKSLTLTRLEAIAGNILSMTSTTVVVSCSSYDSELADIVQHYGFLELLFDAGTPA